MKGLFLLCMKNIWLLPRKIILLVIRGYQKTISPDHGLFKNYFPNGYCKFTPTCSEYGYQAIDKYGLIKGGFKAFYRILRCNPCSKGGVDHVK